MSGTPEYYFKQRWSGLESLSKIVVESHLSGKRNSLELSLGEQLQDLTLVIESVLASRHELREALFEMRLGEDEFCHDVSVIESRVERLVSAINEHMGKVVRMRNDLLVSVLNQRTSDKYSA